MSNEELRQHIRELRAAVEGVDPKEASPPAESLRDLGAAVDNVRTSAWALLSPEDPADYQRYLAEIRVRRATETCLDVLADLYPKTLAPNTPGMDVFHATLRELSKQCEATAQGVPHE